MAEIKENMKLERRNYEKIRFIKNGKKYTYTLIEDIDGLYAEEIQEDGSTIKTKIGNFFLRYVKVDDNDKNDSSSKILHYFQVYYINQEEQICLAEKLFCYRNGQYVTAKIESGFPYGAYLDSTTKEVLDYFKGYLKELIHNGVIKDGLCVQNEAIIQSVKEYLIQFVELIQGRENLFLETEFSYKDNIEFYDNYKICSTKDLFIVNRTIDKNYKKVGFYHAKKNCYIMDLPALRRLMLEECKEKMTARNLNEGLRSLRLIGCSYCFKNTSGEYYANLTGLYVDKLIALAYPNSVPDAPNDEIEPEPIEEIPNNAISNDNCENYNNEDDNYKEEGNESTNLSPETEKSIKKLNKKIRNLSKNKDKKKKKRISHNNFFND